MWFKVERCHFCTVNGRSQVPLCVRESEKEYSNMCPQYVGTEANVHLSKQINRDDDRAV